MLKIPSPAMRLQHLVDVSSHQTEAECPDDMGCDSSRTRNDDEDDYSFEHEQE
jgi:hypothetical protein